MSPKLRGYKYLWDHPSFSLARRDNISMTDVEARPHCFSCRISNPDSSSAFSFVVFFPFPFFLFFSSISSLRSSLSPSFHPDLVHRKLFYCISNNNVVPPQHIAARGAMVVWWCLSLTPGHFLISCYCFIFSILHLKGKMDCSVLLLLVIATAKVR